jgi:hypothetical protein
VPILSNVTEPLSQVTNPILNPVTDTVSQATQPLADTLRPLTQPNLTVPNIPGRPTPTPPVASPTQPTGTFDVQQGSSGVITLASSRSSGSSSPQSYGSANSDSIFAGVTGFFSSTLPGVLSGFIGKDLNIIPIILSMIILLLAVAAVGTIVYSSHYGGTLMIGRYNLTKFAKAHDVTQLAAFSIAAISFGIVVSILLFASL